MAVPRLSSCAGWNTARLRGARKAQEFHWFVITLILQSSIAQRTLSTEPFLAESGEATRVGRFSAPQEGNCADLSPLLEDAMQLRKEVPLELVVNMFRKLVSPSLAVDRLDRLM